MTAASAAWWLPDAVVGRMRTWRRQGGGRGLPCRNLESSITWVSSCLIFLTQQLHHELLYATELELCLSERSADTRPLHAATVG